MKFSIVEFFFEVRSTTGPISELDKCIRDPLITLLKLVEAISSVSSASLLISL